MMSSGQDQITLKIVYSSLSTMVMVTKLGKQGWQEAIILVHIDIKSYDDTSM